MSLGKPRWKAVPWIAALLVFMVAITGNVLVPQYTVPAAVADPNGPGWPPGPGTGPGTGSGSGQQGAVPGKVAPQAPVNPGQVAPDPAVSPNTGNTGNSGNTGPNVQSPDVPNPPSNGKPIFNGDNPAQNPDSNPADSPADTSSPDQAERPDQTPAQQQEKKNTEKCKPNSNFDEIPFDDDEDAENYRKFARDARKQKEYTDYASTLSRPYTADHVIPLRRLWNIPGFKHLDASTQFRIANNLRNLRPLHYKLNSSKKSKLNSEYGKDGGWNLSPDLEDLFSQADFDKMCADEEDATAAVIDATRSATAGNGVTDGSDTGTADAGGSQSGSDSGTGDESDGGSNSEPTVTATIPPYQPPAVPVTPTGTPAEVPLPAPAEATGYQMTVPGFTGDVAPTEGKIEIVGPAQQAADPGLTTGQKIGLGLVAVGVVGIGVAIGPAGWAALGIGGSRALYALAA